MIRGLLISHGSPTVLIEGEEWKRKLKELGERIKEEVKPEVIVVSSPHFISWTEENLVEVGEKLKCIQDYYGFPKELYEFCYEAYNDLDVVNELKSFLKPDDKWGLDHGAWIPLMFTFPGIKAVTISISQASAKKHYEIGEKIGEVIRKLGKRAVFLATSSPTHRLDLFYLNVKPKPSMFDLILQDLINEGRFDEILNAEKIYEKEFKSAMPEGELKPLYMLLGAVKPTRGRVIDYEVPWPGVSMMVAEFFS